MSKAPIITALASLANQTTATNTINTNEATLAAAFDNTLSLDGTAPNQMTAALDMNSQRVINLPAPLTASEPVRLGDLGSTLPVLTTLSSFGASLVNAASAAAARTLIAVTLTTLGVTAAAQSVLTLATNALMLTQLGITTAAQSVLSQVSNAAMMTQLGITTAAQTVLAQTTNALMLTQLGATTIGGNLFRATTNNLAQQAMGMASASPAASAVTVPASPGTITCGSSPESHYITGGTVTVVATGGRTIATSSSTIPVSIHLWPGESYSITYSVVPTVSKVVH